MGSTWKAVAWDEGIILVGLILVAAAALSSLQDCTVSLGCGGDSSSSGGALVLLVAIGLVSLAGASFVAARLSGWPSAGRAAAVALVGCLVALALGTLLIRAFVDSYLPALTLALAVQAGIAVRAPSSRAIRARVVVAALIVVASCLLAAGSRPSSGMLLVLVLVAIPAIGVADTLASLRVDPKRS